MTARADRVPMGFGSDIDAGEVATRLNAGSCRAFLASHPTHALPEIAGIGFVGGFICVEHEQQLFYRYDGDRRAYRAAAILDAGDVAGAARAEADLTQAIQHHIEKTEAEWAPFIPRAQFGSRPCSSLSAADIQRGSGWGSIGPALALACSGPAHAYIYIATEDGFARRAILPLRSGNEELRARAVALVQEEAQRRPGILTVPARPSHRASTPAVDENPAPEAVERSHVSSQSRLFWLLIAFAVIVAIVVLVVFRWLFQSWEQDKRRRAADEAMRRMEELRRLEVERERLRQQPITDAAEQLRRMQQQMQDEIERIKRTLGGNTP